MTKKRGNNEGTIFKLSNGHWRAQVSLQGKRLSKTCRTQKECQDWLKKTARQVDDGLTAAGAKISLAEYLSGWLVNARSRLRPTTWRHYEQIVRAYISPELGRIKLKDLRPDQVQDLYNRLLERGTSVYIVLKVHETLHAALAQALRLSLVVRNVASLVRPPRPPGHEMAILDETQVNRLLLTAKGHRWEALYHLAIITGMRQMELLGLKWTDLDWTRKTLKVERQLDRGYGHGPEFSAPKTRFGKRSIALGSRTIEVLRSHYDRQWLERKAAGERWVEHGLMFTNNIGGAIDPHNLLRDYKRLLREAELPDIRFHDLRHTAASLMLNNGVAVIIVSRRLGHSRASITLDVYGHLIPSMQEEAADLIDSLVIPIPLQQAPTPASTDPQK